MSDPRHYCLHLAIASYRLRANGLRVFPSHDVAYRVRWRRAAVLWHRAAKTKPFNQVFQTGKGAHDVSLRFEGRAQCLGTIECGTGSRSVATDAIAGRARPEVIIVKLGPGGRWTRRTVNDWSRSAVR